MRSNPAAAINVGRIIAEHLARSKMSIEQLGQRLEMKPGAKLNNLIAGRHYFPIHLMRPIVEALGIERESFARAVLLQFYSEDKVEGIAQMFASAESDRGTSHEGDPHGQSSNNTPKDGRINLELRAQNMEQANGDAESRSNASQADHQFWRILKKGFRTGLSARGIAVGEKDLILALRFMLEEIESSGLLVVPITPTKKMHKETKHAFDPGKRRSMGWVGRNTKQRWRYQAAIYAAPSWRGGYEMDKKTEDEKTEG